MPRATNPQATRNRRKRFIKAAKGFFGNKSRLFRYAKDAVIRGGKFAYNDRRRKKSTMRQLWIVRLNAACRPLGITYCRLIEGLKAANIEMDRKALSELAIHDETSFKALVEKAQAALKDKNLAAA